MRICAISLPELRIELVRHEMEQARRKKQREEHLPSSGPSLNQEQQALPLDFDEDDDREGQDEVEPPPPPIAVVVAPAPMTETKLLGNTRLSVVSREARALGVLPGHTIAQARARAGDLAVRVVRPEAVRDVLARIAEVGLAFGATVSFDMTGSDVLLAAATSKKRGGRAAGAGALPEPQAGGSGQYGDVVWIDITGCAHLHAPAPGAHEPRPSLFDGETILASRLAGVIASLGHTCSVAIADGPRIAAMLARASAETAARAAVMRGSRSKPGLLLLEPTVVKPGENAAAIASLPVSMLPIPSEDVRWLTKIGVRTIQELRQLPREGLGTRLGARAREVISLAYGEDRAPLTSYVPPEVPVEEAQLEYGIEGTQALTFVAKTLTDRLAARLQGRAVAAARVELELKLDAAMLRDREHDRTPARRRDVEGPPSAPMRSVTMGTSARFPNPPAATMGTSARFPNPPAVTMGTSARSATVLVALDLPVPLSLASDLLAALRPKIERLVLEAPVLSASLRAPVLVQKRAAALSLFEPQPKAERALPRLVAELVSDLGSHAVSKLVLGDSWVPEERSRLVPFHHPDVRARASASEITQREKKQTRFLLSSVPEPTRLLVEPRPVTRENVRVTRHLTRVEALEWWKSIPSAEEPSARRRPVDYVEAWIDDGAAWVEIDRATGAMRVLGLFD